MSFFKCLWQTAQNITVICSSKTTVCCNNDISSLFHITFLQHGMGCISTICSDIRNNFFRSEEHTSELQSRFDLVCRLLLEKKKHRAKFKNDKTMYVSTMAVRSN